MRSERKHVFLHEFLVILLVIVLAKCGTKIWPVSLALLLAALVHGIRKLFLWGKRRHHAAPAADQPPTPPEPVPQPAPVMERDLVSIAFGLLQRRITEQITAAYPGVRWVWECPGARERFAAGEALTIQLNRAGGYRTAVVLVQHLQFRGLVYLPAKPEPEPEEPPEEEKPKPAPVDYGLLAFEWVEANLQRLNRLASDEKARLHIGFRIPAEELPHGDSWPAVCKALLQNGFDAAEPVADGILVRFKKNEEEM